MSDEQSSTEDDERDSLPKSSQRRKKPKVEGDWTETDVRSLIQAIKLRGCIWDSACVDHNNGIKRSSAWQSISDEFNNRFTPSMLKAKWNVIKTTYSKNKSKFFSWKSAQVTNENKLPSWIYWKDMLFIYEHDMGNGSKSVSNSSFDVDNIIEDESSLQSIPLSRSPTAVVAVTETTDVKQNNKKRKILPTTPAQSQQYSFDSEGNLSRAVDVSNIDNDEWDIFGIYMATQMRKINDQNRRIATQVQRTINNVTLDALDKLYAGPSLISSTIPSVQGKYQIQMVPMVPNLQIASANEDEFRNGDI